MAAVNAISRERTAEDLKDLYDDVAKRYGRVPNIVGVMAHRPGAVKAFSQLYGAVMSEGSVEPRYKELAYLKTSLVNGCEY
jgi:alkylhydroperoxidase family enzyme